MFSGDYLEQLLVSFEGIPVGWRNRRSLALGRVEGAVRALEICVDDYERARDVYKPIAKRYRDQLLLGPPGSRAMTAEESELSTAAYEAGFIVRVRIKAAYIFARILLDEICWLLDACLAPRGQTIGKHSNLRQRLPKLIARVIPDCPDERLGELLSLASTVDGTVVKFRDHSVVHMRPLDASEGMIQSLQDEDQVMLGVWDPRGGLAQSTPIDVLRDGLHEYVEGVVKFIRDFDPARQGAVS